MRQKQSLNLSFFEGVYIWLFIYSVKYKIGKRTQPEGVAELLLSSL